MVNQQTEVNEILTAFLEHCRRPAGKLVGGLDPDETSGCARQIRSTR